MVHPDHNSKGYGKEMMFYTLDYVITKNKKENTYIYQSTC